MVSKYLLLAVIFSGLVTWIPRMIPFILVKYKGLPAIVERFFEILACFYYLCLDSFKRSDSKVGSLPQIKWLDFLSSLSNGLGSLSLPQSSWNSSLWSGLNCSLAFGLLILFENQIQTTSASPYRTQVQLAASFLVCSLIFIEY